MAGFIQQYWILIVFGAAMVAMHLGHRGGHGGMGGCGGSHTGHTGHAGHQGAGPAEHEEAPTPAASSPASDRRTQGAATPQDSLPGDPKSDSPAPAHQHQ